MMVEKFRKLLLVFLALTVGLAIYFAYMHYEPFRYQPARGYFRSAWGYFLEHIVNPIYGAAVLSLGIILVCCLVCYVVPMFYRDTMDIRQWLRERANARAVYESDLDEVDEPAKSNEVKQENPPKVSTPANAPVAPVATKPKNASVRMRDVPSEDPPPHITEVPPPTRLPSGPTNETKQPKPKQSDVDFKDLF